MALIAHWPLNGNFNDYSGNNNNLTYQNNNNKIIIEPAGKIGAAYKRAVIRDGADWLESNNNVNFQGDFTFAIWAYVSAVHSGTANGLLTNHNHNNNTGAGITVREISSSDYRISCNTGTGSSRTFNTFFGTTNIKNKWSHLVLRFIKETNTFSLWTNGNKELEWNYTQFNVSQRIGLFSWSLGYNNSSDYRPATIMNDARVYDHALSDYEVKELAKAKITHLPLDGHSLDVAGYLYNGTPQASTSYTTNSKIYSQAFQNTDGGGSKAITIANGTQNITGDQTIAMWLFPTSFAARRNPWNKAYGGEGTITQELSGTLTYFWGTHGGDNIPYQGFASGALTLNVWNHVALVRDLSAVTPQLRWYINGVLSTAATPSYTAATATTNGTTIGAGYTSPYHGRISDVRQYGTALTVTDILALYNKRANFDNLGNVSVNELNEYQEPIISDGLILNLDANNKSSISPIGCTGFNNAPQLVKSTVNTSTYTITNDTNIRLGNLNYFTAFAIDYPESSYGGDAVNRDGITPGFNVKTGTKLYDGGRALHLWVFNNSTNTWLPTSYFNGWAGSGHIYDVYSGSAIRDSELTKFINDYNVIKSTFKNCTYIIMGSHRADYYPQSLLDLLIDAGAPSNASSLLIGQQPEFILIGEPGLSAGNAYSWAIHNYSTNPAQVAHTNFGLPLYGRKGNYFDIATSTNYISVSDNALLDIVGDKTLSCWVYMGADTSGAGIVAKANSTVNGMALGYGYSGNGFLGLAWNSTNTPGIAKDAARDIQKWCFLTVTQSGSTRTLYVYDEQGLRTATSTAGTHTWNNSLPLYIGANSDGTSRIPNGSRIAMVSVYNRAITSNEVLTNFNNTKTNYYNDGNKNTINSLGQALYSDFVEDELLASGVKQAITNNGSLVINGEFSEVD